MTTTSDLVRNSLNAHCHRHDRTSARVDAGGGWLIFKLPPAELGVHPGEGPTYEAGFRHQLTLMCDDLEATMRELKSKGVTINGTPEDEGWGITVMLQLTSDLEVMLYQPKHPAWV